MTILKKSNYNMSVADLMDKEGYYAPSVHTSYYGAFLFVAYILCNCLSVDYQKQKEDSKGKDSHRYLMDYIKNDLHNKSVFDEKRFLMKFNALRKNRRKADYLVDAIDKTFADQCLNDSTKLREELANIYKIAV